MEKDTKKILAARLEFLTERQRDVDHRLSDKKQAEIMNIPYTSFMDYVHGKRECSISVLNKIAQYYHISTDFLLGRTNVSSPKATVRNACAVTSLSEQAVKSLVWIKNHTFLSHSLSQMGLGAVEGSDLIGIISELLTSKRKLFIQFLFILKQLNRQPNLIAEKNLAQYLSPDSDDSNAEESFEYSVLILNTLLGHIVKELADDMQQQGSECANQNRSLIKIRAVKKVLDPDIINELHTFMSIVDTDYEEE